MKPRLALYVLSMELRQVLSYRVDFWVNFLGMVGSQFLMAYFLWSSIFASRGVEEIGGFTFPQMMLYYLLVPLVVRIVKGKEMDIFSTEIYEGILTRYLVYPVSFLAYKYISQIALAVLATIQFGLAIVLAWALYPQALGEMLTLRTIVLGLLTCLAASLLYYFIAACLEMTAFWADNVWSLLVMLRFMIALLGGSLIPLDLFPERLEGILRLLPFSLLVSFPVEVMMGRVSTADYFGNLVLMMLWTMAFYAIARRIWTAGNYRYTGVGI